MTLKLHNTLTRKKVPFSPTNPERVTMYVCGPTVYNYAHIGNARPAVVFDVLFRLLSRLYGEGAVVYARNVTDVDDKINAKATEEGVEIGVVTRRYLTAYHEDMGQLGVLRPTIEPHATDYIGPMQAMIAALIERGHAYAAEGHVLFDTSSFADYGKLSGRTLDDMIAGARVEVAPYKRNPADFVMWKPSKPGEPVWDSPWGAGRPGWHIECSAMIEQTLGLPIDIHGGGHDLTFPHHENEIAQGVCAQGDNRPTAYARYWMHNGFLTMDAEKMSKSLGNVLLVHDLVKVFPGEVVRWALLSASYRSPLNWTDDVLAQSRSRLDYLYGVMQRAQGVETGVASDGDKVLLNALLDDLNTPGAQYELGLRAKALDDAVRTKSSNAPALKAELLVLADILGFLGGDPDAWFKTGVDDDLSGRIETLLQQRIEARAAKDFAAADAIRNELDDMSVVVMDGPAGATWRLK